MSLPLNQSVHRGRCHCGSVEFTAKLSNGLHTGRRCNCSFCEMRGAVAVTADHGDITVTKGEDVLTLYQFNKKVAEHYFCKQCGIYTFHRRRSNPNEWGINVACLEGLSPFDFPRVEVNNGKQHPADYPEDAPTPYQNVVGYLCFEINKGGDG